MKRIIVIFLSTWIPVMAFEQKEIPIIGQYNDQLIAILVYMNGPNFLSQGGPARIDYMVDGIELADKNLLDLGCGVGGPALYLAQRYQAQVHGVDVDPYLIERAHENKRDSKQKHEPEFLVIEPNKLPFEDNFFDIVFSKEAIVHVKNKKLLFQELYRVLKPGGILIIMDWFKTDTTVSEDLQVTLDLDKLIMHYMDIKDYCQLLNNAGFKDMAVTETSLLHLRDMEYEYGRLQTEAAFKELFGQQTLEESLATWHAHSEVLKSKEIQTFLIRAYK